MLSIVFFFPRQVPAQHRQQLPQAVQKEDSASYYITSGQRLAKERKFKEALTAFGNARKFDNKNEEAILGQMNMYFYLRRVEDGLKVIEDWTVVDPGNPKAWKTMADYFDLTGKKDEALRAAGKLIELQPGSAGNRVLKAELLLEADHPQEAAEAAGEAFTLNPEDGKAWYVKAYSLAKLGKYEEAVTACDQAIDRFPGAVEGYYTRACMQVRKGDNDKALADLRKSVGLDSTVMARAKEDPDFKPLYGNEKFRNITGMTTAEADEAALADSVCVIPDRKYAGRDYRMKIAGSWKADKAYVHGKDLLGGRNFFFEFKPDRTLEIREPESKFNATGTWQAGDSENSLEWTMPDKNTSFRGKYDLISTGLIISGQGFVGEFEQVCLRLRSK